MLPVSVAPTVWRRVNDGPRSDDGSRSQVNEAVKP